jgi:hypothetical protein
MIDLNLVLGIVFCYFLKLSRRIADTDTNALR